MKLFHCGEGKASFGIDTDAAGNLRAAFSFAHPNDEFKKSVARQTIESRLKSERTRKDRDGTVRKNYVELGYVPQSNKFFMELVNAFRNIVTQSPHKRVRVSRVRNVFSSLSKEAKAASSYEPIYDAS